MLLLHVEAEGLSRSSGEAQTTRMLLSHLISQVLTTACNHTTKQGWIDQDNHTWLLGVDVLAAL